MRKLNMVGLLCLDSKYEGGKLIDDLDNYHRGLCLDSKYEGGKLSSTSQQVPSCFALIPNTRAAN